MRTYWSALFALAVACGNGGENTGTNAGNTNSQTTPNVACEVDDDCTGSTDAAFSNPDNARCTMSAVRGNYCSECINDSQCMPGFACRDATFCEALPPCDEGIECADVPGEVHDACIMGFCKACADDLDCGMDEICYSRKCVTRTAVDPTCIEASCMGPCEFQYDDSGAATGVGCVE